MLILLQAYLNIDSKLAWIRRGLHDYTKAIEVLERSLEEAQGSEPEEHVINRE